MSIAPPSSSSSSRSSSISSRNTANQASGGQVNPFVACSHTVQSDAASKQAPQGSTTNAARSTSLTNKSARWSPANHRLWRFWLCARVLCDEAKSETAARPSCLWLSRINCASFACDVQLMNCSTRHGVHCNVCRYIITHKSAVCSAAGPLAINCVRPSTIYRVIHPHTSQFSQPRGQSSATPG